VNPITKRRCVYCRAHNVWDRVLYLDAIGNVTTYPARVMEMGSVICLSCKQLQPLGESNDAGERVEIELLAATYAAEWDDEGHVPGCDRFESCPRNGVTNGFCDICQTYWLAREIVMHDDARCISTHATKREEGE
jgi:hypothetical protein